jgi:hypothetical protein
LTVSEEELCGVAYCSPVAVLSRYVFVENWRLKTTTYTCLLSSSTLLILHSSYRLNQDGTVCTDAEQSYLTVMEMTAQVILPIARRLQTNSSSSPHYPSPLVLDWMYHSVVLFHGLEQGNHCSFYEDCVRTIREAMTELSLQWPVGSRKFLPCNELTFWHNGQMFFLIFLKPESWPTCKWEFWTRFLLKFYLPVLWECPSPCGTQYCNILYCCDISLQY